MDNLSEKAKEALDTYTKHFHADVIRPDKDTNFMVRAFDNSKMSHDAQTKCGCVITRDNKILVDGYNGFPRKFPDHLLPNLRALQETELPTKYDWMVHAETNAICNSAYEGTSIKNSVAYITTKPCKVCSLLLYQAGVVELVYPKNHNMPAMMQNKNYDVFFELFEYFGNGKIIFREIDFDIDGV